MFFKRILQAIVISFFTLSFSGCTTLDILASHSFEAPTFKYKRYKIGTPTDKTLPIIITLDAHNPNLVGLRDIHIDYELFYKDKRFLKGNDIDLELAPNSISEITVPAELHFKNAIKTGGRVAEKILSGKKRIKFQAKITVYGSPTIYDDNKIGKIFPFSMNITKTIKVKIPRDKIENSLDGTAKTMYQIARKVSDAKDEVKKLKKMKKDIKKFSKLF